MAEPSLHHAGYVVRSIADGLERWKNTLQPVTVSEAADDPLQKARVLFLHFAGSATSIELVEPLSSDAPVAKFLEKGGGLHHLCFEVDDLAAHLAAMKVQGALLIRHPKPAVAFEGRQIAWMVTRERLVVEYLERAAQAQ